MGLSLGALVGCGPVETKEVNGVTYELDRETGQVSAMGPLAECANVCEIFGCTGARLEGSSCFCSGCPATDTLQEQ